MRLTFMHARMKPISVMRFSTKLAESHISDRELPSNYLLDKFGRFHDYLRISLTERCNLRCMYCMPEKGVSLTPNENLLQRNEIFRLSELFVKLGVNTIRFTGGEPLIRKDILEIIEDVNQLKMSNDSEIGLKKILMTTNGIGLYRKLDKLMAAGLDGVNISLDSLNAEKFGLITRRGGSAGLQKVWKSIETCLEKNLASIKINCVVMRNVNDDELWDFVQLTKDLNIEVRFIEYMPFGGNKWDLQKTVPFWEMLDMIKKQQKASSVEYQELAPLKKQEKHGTAKLYQLPNYKGRVGFITSNTLNFCGTCNRIRLTADGHLKPCLHDNFEVNLRDTLRKESFEKKEIDRELTNLIKSSLAQKKEQHEDVVRLSNKTNRPMILIGG